MSMELPRAWSGSKRMGAAEEEMWTVAGTSAGVESFAAARSAGTTESVAAPAVPRNLRREMRGSFMGRRKYSGKRKDGTGRFYSGACSQSVLFVSREKQD